MTAHARFREADATRALRAAVKAGLIPSGYRIDADGAIVVMFGEEQKGSSNSFDDMIGKSQ